MNLQQLIKEAKTFGSAACNEGIHQWETDGGRACPRDLGPFTTVQEAMSAVEKKIAEAESAVDKYSQDENID